MVIIENAGNERRSLSGGSKTIQTEKGLALVELGVAGKAIHWPNEA